MSQAATRRPQWISTALVLIMTIAAVGLLYHWPSDIDPDTPKVVVEHVARDDSARSDTETLAPRREPAELGHSIRVTVTDSDGELLKATARIGATEYRIDGSGHVLANGPTMHVFAAGYVPQDVSTAREQSDIRVTLQRSFIVEGFAYDAATQIRLRGARVTLENAAGQRITDESETDQSGHFHLESPEGGTLVIRGLAAGYLPMSGKAGEPYGGVRIEVRERTRVEIPMRPIYVALCALQNSTNLDDAVLRSLVACRFVEQPGRELPEWHSRTVLKQIAKAAEELGIKHAYGQACYAERPPESLQGRAAFVARGQGSLGAATVVFQPLVEFQRRPMLAHHVANRQWTTSRLTIEAPLALRVCVKSGFVFGGLPTEPGRFTYELPNGSYIVSPLDDHALLTGKSWKQLVELDGPRELKIMAPEGFATLKIIGGEQWPQGILTCSGNGANLAIPLKNLPFETPASPGQFRFRVIVGSGQSEEVVWSKEVSITADKEVILRVGPA
jgi:hypothetical protein